jgi:hypothetical protein
MLGRWRSPGAGAPIEQPVADADHSFDESDGEVENNQNQDHDVSDRAPGSDLSHVRFCASCAGRPL